MNKIDIPVVNLGPGSQPAEADGAELAYLPLPKEMDNYVMPILPEPEAVQGLDEALALLASLLETLRKPDPDASHTFDLTAMDEANRALLDQVLGEGEVSIVCEGPCAARIQEAVLAGVWRLQYLDEGGRVLRDVIEVAAIPALVREQAFAGARPALALDDAALPPGVLNAPPLVVELGDRVAAWRPGVAPHVINLTLLPQTPEDLAFLGDRLGAGKVSILSRGYGNCRITSTATRHVWWVQYFNSQDVLILNTLEVTGVPEVACASREDLEDSAQRLTEILEVYQ